MMQAARNLNDPLRMEWLTSMREESWFESPLKGMKVLVTGHTGFTGGWACTWLRAIGAKVFGYALPPNTTPALFDSMETGDVVSKFSDIRDRVALTDFVGKTSPELVLHLAAQPLVRRSYRDPVETFEVNALGTVNVLEAARQVASVRGVVCVTTDKVYRNNEWPWPYRENDPLGGKDPYSASKAAAEMAIDSYSASFGSTAGRTLAIATARGGNIIGGGDWAEDRLIPDFVRAVVSGTPLTLRYPQAVRPWQHVLALVQGYLTLLAGLISEDPHRYARAWNFGPQDPAQLTVRDVLEAMSREWVRPRIEYMNEPLPEAGSLALDSSLARNALGWRPAWTTGEIVRHTAGWYRDYYQNPKAARAITEAQLDEWRSALRGEGGRETGR